MWTRAVRNRIGALALAVLVMGGGEEVAGQAADNENQVYANCWPLSCRR